ncbi:MAG: polyprenyl synthetase family protein [Clostridiales bacterium]|nr:polyprenyl synthetase family protein [Clostridiales bacterium]
MIRYRKQIEDALTACMDRPMLLPQLREQMAYSLLGGGKRIRPSLCLAACEMLGGDIKEALPFACALEMIHTYSLIHDDLPAMDNDDERRGKPSSHKRFGEANAILAGDALLTYAFWILNAVRGHEPAKSELSYAALAMVEGQSLDLADSAADADLLFEITRKKTGALFTAAVLTGGLVAGCDDDQYQCLNRFGEAFGILFQMADDRQDREQDAAIGKKTLLTCYGKERAQAEMAALSAEAFAALAPFSGQAADYLRGLTAALAENGKWKVES